MDLLFVDGTDTGVSLEELKNPVIYRGYLQSMSHFSSYSWRNVFLIYKQMPHASKLAEFKRWKEQYGRTVKQGSKSIKINAPFEPKPIKKLVEKIDPSTGAVVLDDNGKRVMEELIINPPVQFKQVNLLDVSQTEGKPLMRLAGDVVSDGLLFGVFIDVLKLLSPFISLHEIENPAPVDIWDAINLIAVEKLDNIDTDMIDFISESICFVVCWRFGIDVDFNGLVPVNNLDADMLETICKQSDSLITCIEDRFAVICNERGLEPLTLHKTAAPQENSGITSSHNETKLQVEPTTPEDIKYKKVLRTENVAGVEFSQFDVKPLSENEIENGEETGIVQPAPPPAKQTTTTGKRKPNALIDLLTLKHPPDAAITIAERNQYGYTRPELLPITKERAIILFRRDMVIYLLFKDNTEAMARYITDIYKHDGIFGISNSKWQKSWEYLALASGNPEAIQEANFIHDSGDSFAIYQIKQGDSPLEYKSYEELQKSEHSIDRLNYCLVYFSDLPAPPSDSPEGIFMWVNAEQLDGYKGRAMAISDVLTIKKSGVITSHYANGRTFKELLDFIGDEGRRDAQKNDVEIIVSEDKPTKPDVVQEKQEAAISSSAEQTHTPNQQDEQPPKTENTAQTTPDMSKSTAPAAPPSLPIIISEVPLLKISEKEADSYGVMELYELNRRIDLDCIKGIDEAIKTYKTGANRYDLETPADVLLDSYGAVRLIWVLFRHISAKPTGFSEDNAAWINGYIGDEHSETQPINANTHNAVLDAFIYQLRAIFNKKPTFNERLKSAKKKSEEYNNSNG